MARSRRIFAKLRSLVANKRAEEDLAREVASHLTLLADDLERRGMPRLEAQLAARRAYGGVEQAKQAHREERSLLWIEVGIRMALGAERRDVLLLILRSAFLLVVCGLSLGLASTWIATRLLKSFLFGVTQHDPFTVVTVSMLLLVCGLLAAVLPACRAASIDPMQALRTE